MKTEYADSRHVCSKACTTMELQGADILAMSDCVMYSILVRKINLEIFYCHVDMLFTCIRSSRSASLTTTACHNLSVFAPTEVPNAFATLQMNPLSVPTILQEPFARATCNQYRERWQCRCGYDESSLIGSGCESKNEGSKSTLQDNPYRYGNSGWPQHVI